MSEAPQLRSSTIDCNVGDWLYDPTSTNPPVQGTVISTLTLGGSTVIEVMSGFPGEEARQFEARNVEGQQRWVRIR